MNAPNTPRGQITRDGEYHAVADEKHRAFRCSRCKVIADPHHAYQKQGSQSIRSYCGEHCPACVAFRKSVGV